ncbi:DUF317 domain-containing protein [Streptomyces sp. NPDC002285]
MPARRSNSSRPSPTPSPTRPRRRARRSVRAAPTDRLDARLRGQRPRVTDGTAYLQRLGSAEEAGAWFVTATLGLDRPVWQARFDAHTPARVVAAFAAALADPKPVPRIDSGRSLPTRAPSIVTRRTTDVLAVNVAGALEERVQSLAARRAAPPTSPIPTRQPPAKNNRSR